jgi:iron complex transport system substrate-binding protein
MRDTMNTSKTLDCFATLAMTSLRGAKRRSNPYRWIQYLIVGCMIVLSCGKNNSETKTSAAITPPPPTRIVSFAPNITEILYELGLGDKICGVTQFCRYPPEAAQKEKIGGHADRNYEAVVRLKPDLAIILKEQRDMIAFFDQYAIRYVAVGSDSVDEILESIQSVANACSITDRGKIIAENLRKRMEPVSVDGRDDKPRVLLCVSRDGIGGGTIGKCFVAGATSFYDQLIDAAGGVNVMKEVKQAYPTITAEAVIRLVPDVIIDLSMSYTGNHQQQQKSCGDWAAFKTVPAVKAGMVRCLSGDYLTIPGPRIGLILEDFKNVLHSR